MIKPLFFTISEQIADTIRKDIIFGDLIEGMPLREVELSNKYNVSRGPVRDALKELAKEGFLDMVPNVGVRVAKQPSDATLELVIKMRKDLENFVIEQVYDQFNESDYADLRELLELFKQACENGNMQEIINLDIEYHRYIVHKMEDLHIRDLWVSVVNRMLFRYNRFENIIDCYDEHLKIYEALMVQNKDLILNVLDNHIV